MSLTRKDIEEIMALLEASRFDRLNLEMDGVKLELVRSGAGPKSASASAPSPVPAPAPAPAPAPQTTLIPAPANVARAPAEGLVEVKSPLLGIYYRAPKPGEPSFVEVGDRVEPDTIIGIVEVMKLMNSARAGVAGTVVEILGQNGELVEHGEVLLLVKPD